MFQMREMFDYRSFESLISGKIMLPSPRIFGEVVPLWTCIRPTRDATIPNELLTVHNIQCTKYHEVLSHLHDVPNIQNLSLQSYFIPTSLK
jgi:hypothetical protein